MNIMKKKYLEFLAIYFVTRVYDIIVDKLKQLIGYVHHIIIAFVELPWSHNIGNARTLIFILKNTNGHWVT
jgi:hypothetical protein